MISPISVCFIFEIYKDKRTEAGTSIRRKPLIPKPLLRLSEAKEIRKNQRKKEKNLRILICFSLITTINLNAEASMRRPRQISTI